MSRRSAGTVARPAWLGLGLIATALGIAGAVLPLVPTTPFLLVAAYAFARSSPRLHGWLLSHRHFGPLIENWRRHGAISRRTKRISVVVMALMVLVSWLLGLPALVVAIQAAVLACTAAFILTRPDEPCSCRLPR